jgi:hypothetical protein
MCETRQRTPGEQQLADGQLDIRGSLINVRKSAQADAAKHKNK